MSKRILVIAPHPDDETLGVGGTIAKHTAQGDNVIVLTVSGHLPPLYSREEYDVTIAEAKKAHALLGISESIFLEIPATMISNEPVHIFNKRLVDVVQQYKPDIVLCPYPDRHIDHRLVFESTLVATRPVNAGREIEIIAAYETISETHWNAPHIEPNFTPNWVVDISDYVEIKLNALKLYESQVPPFPGPRSLEAVEALAKFRGTQAGFGYGEGLHIIRMIT